MKTIYNNISLLGLLLVLGLTSCESFLAEYSQDEVAPKNVREYSQILYGEAYLRGEELPYSYLELLTDNVKIVSNSRNESTGTDVRVKGWGYFTWQASPEKTASGGLNIDRSWRVFYRHILASNIILKEMPNMTGDESEKAQLRAKHMLPALMPTSILPIFMHLHTTQLLRRKLKGCLLMISHMGKMLNFLGQHWLITTLR